MFLTNWLDDLDRLGGCGEVSSASAVLGSHTELVLLAFLQAGDTESGVQHRDCVIGHQPLSSATEAELYHIVGDGAPTIAVWGCPFESY